MKNITSLLLLSLFVVLAGGAARAADDKPMKPKAAASAKPAGKEVTLAGTFGCGKCSFKDKDVKQCQNVLKVKDGDKMTSYQVAKNAVSDQSHEAICHSAGKPAHVTGMVGEEGGKKTITPSAIKFD
jgi:hypothetical protein